MAESSKRRFIWGWGRLPPHCRYHRTLSSVPKPKLLDALESPPLAQLLVANGILAVTHAGDMYAWGAPGHTPPPINPSACSACLDLQPSPPPFSRVQPLENKSVSHVTLTTQQCVVVTTEGSVYRWSFEREEALNPPLEPLSVDASSPNSLASLSPVSTRPSTPPSLSPAKSTSTFSALISPSETTSIDVASPVPICHNGNSFSTVLPESKYSPPVSPFPSRSPSASPVRTRKPPPPPPLSSNSSVPPPPPPPPPSPSAPPSPPLKSQSDSCLPSSASSAALTSSADFLASPSASPSSSSKVPTTDFSQLPSSSTSSSISSPDVTLTISSSPSLAAVLSRLDASIDASKAALCLEHRTSAYVEYKCVPGVMEGIPPMQQVDGTGKNSLLLGKDGQLYYSSNNLCPVSIPLSIVTGDKVISIACGFSHSLAITAQGNVLSWGQGEGGRLGLGDELARAEPTRITRLDYAQVVEVACGYHHSLARSALGRVYVWGGNQFGQLGCGDKLQKLIPTKLGPLPDSEGGAQNKVISLSAGAFHTGLVTSRGELLTCGWGEYGQLGIGDETNRSIPTVVGALRGMDVSMVACAGRYTVCVTEYFIKINMNHFSSDSDNAPAEFVSPPFIATDNTPIASPQRLASETPSKVSIHLPSKPLTPAPTNGSQHELLFKLIRGLVPPADELLPLRVHMPVNTHPCADFTLPPFVTMLNPEQVVSEVAQSYRPTHFPSKSPEETKKHAAEAEKMNARYQKKLEIKDKESTAKRFINADAAAASRAKAEKDLKKKQAREKLMDAHTKEWVKKVLPNWGTQKTLQKAQKLGMKLGIPPSIRPTIWPQLVGNVLSIDEEVYRVVSLSASSARTRWERLRSDVDEGKESTFMNIDVDLARTFPQLAFFKSHGAHHLHLQAMLDTHCYFRPELGYVQGMSYLAGILLLYMSPFEAFVCFANLLDRPYAHAFLELNMEKMNARYKLHQTLLKEYHSDLADWLEGLNLQPEMYLMDWFIALFCKSLPIELVGRVWDGYLLFGESFVYRTSAAICAVLKPRLLNQPLDVCLKVLKCESQSLDEDLLFEHIAKIKLSEKDIAKLEASERALTKPEKTAAVLHISTGDLDAFVSSPKASPPTTLLSPSVPPPLALGPQLSGSARLISTMLPPTRDKTPSKDDTESENPTLSPTALDSTDDTPTKRTRIGQTLAQREEVRRQEVVQRDALLKELEAKRAELLQDQEFMAQRVVALKAALNSSPASPHVTPLSNEAFDETAATVQHLEGLSEDVIARLDMRDTPPKRSPTVSPERDNTQATSIPRSLSFSSVSSIPRRDINPAPHRVTLARSDPPLSRSYQASVSHMSVSETADKVRQLLSSKTAEDLQTRAPDRPRLGEERNACSQLEDRNYAAPRLSSKLSEEESTYLTDEQLQYERDLAKRRQFEGLPPAAPVSCRSYVSSSSAPVVDEGPVTMGALADRITKLLKPVYRGDNC